MLNAFNGDDYEAASRDWSDVLKDELDRTVRVIPCTDPWPRRVAKWRSSM